MNLSEKGKACLFLAPMRSSRCFRVSERASNWLIFFFFNFELSSHRLSRLLTIELSSHRPHRNFRAYGTSLHWWSKVFFFFSFFFDDQPKTTRSCSNTGSAYTSLCFNRHLCPILHYLPAALPYRKHPHRPRCPCGTLQRPEDVHEFLQCLHDIFTTTTRSLNSSLTAAGCKTFEHFKTFAASCDTQRVMATPERVAAARARCLVSNG